MFRLELITLIAILITVSTATTGDIKSVEDKPYGKSVSPSSKPIYPTGQPIAPTLKPVYAAKVEDKPVYKPYGKPINPTEKPITYCPPSKPICQYGGYCKTDSDCWPGNYCNLDQMPYYSQCLPNPSSYKQDDYCLPNYYGNNTPCSDSRKCCDPGAYCNWNSFRQCQQPVIGSDVCSNPISFIKCTVSPTKKPTMKPTDRPTDIPSKIPSKTPSKIPTDRPTDTPTKIPSKKPSKIPTDRPTDTPSRIPIKSPTSQPI